MKESDKVAISLDRDLLRRTERLRARTGESRSALVARALRGLLSLEDQKRQVEEYVEAYRRHPETDAEVEAARASAKKALHGLPWDEA